LIPEHFLKKPLAREQRTVAEAGKDEGPHKLSAKGFATERRGREKKPKKEAEKLKKKGLEKARGEKKKPYPKHRSKIRGKEKNKKRRQAKRGKKSNNTRYGKTLENVGGGGGGKTIKADRQSIPTPKTKKIVSQKW